MRQVVGLEKISLDEVKSICTKQKLKPGKVKNTNGIQFTRGKNEMIEVIDWPEFEEIIKARKLAVYASKPNKQGNRFMKIMKK